jgi:hypothetical protein
MGVFLTAWTLIIGTTLSESVIATCPIGTELINVGVGPFDFNLPAVSAILPLWSVCCSNAAIVDAIAGDVLVWRGNAKDAGSAEEKGEGGEDVELHLVLGVSAKAQGKWESV